MGLSSKMRLFVLRARTSGKFQLLKYAAVVLYVAVSVLVVTYMLQLSFKSEKEAQERQGDEIVVPESVRRFESVVVEGLGELGVGVNLPQTREDIERQMKLHSYNKYVSDRISVKRSLPDTRHSECRKLDYGPAKDLPKASVILIFCNETLSALMRTVWSVIRETPPDLLHEIVLVDDGSGSEEITVALPEYLRTRLRGRPVHLHRNDKQTGLIAARLEGARHSSGDVIVFLDSHCEATRGWMQPLAFHIKNNPEAVAIPSIDSIDHTTLAFYGSPGGVSIAVGGFTWSGHFTWDNYADAPGDRRASDPAPTPTMAGGLFAMNRRFFWDVGGYDPGMIGWGGENLEMSFRVWQCGGRMDSIPCSHVGHIFRDTHPYFIPDDSHGKNTMRMAEVWMDGYKRFYYVHRVELKGKLASDVSERLALRKRLGCKPFSWYLSHVVPHKYIPDEHSLAWGRLRNRRVERICVDHLQLDQGHHLTPYLLGVYFCHEFLGSSQYFSLSRDHELRNEYMCAEAWEAEGGKKVEMKQCRGGAAVQKWDFSSSGGEMKHRRTGLCLALPAEDADSSNGKQLALEPCDGSSRQQSWSFEFADSPGGGGGGA